MNKLVFKLSSILLLSSIVLSVSAENSTLQIANADQEMLTSFDGGTLQTIDGGTLQISDEDQKAFTSLVKPVIESLSNDIPIEAYEIDELNSKIDQIESIKKIRSIINNNGGIPATAIVPFHTTSCPKNWIAADGRVLTFGYDMDDPVMMLLWESHFTLEVIPGYPPKLKLPDLRDQFISGWNKRDTRHVGEIGFGTSISVEMDRYWHNGGRGPAVKSIKIGNVTNPRSSTPVEPRPNSMKLLYCMKLPLINN